MRRKHKGLRPQDIVILLKILSIQSSDWLIMDLVLSLKISLSEVSESLDRSKFSGLLSEDKKRVNRKGLFELLIYGLKYVFPTQPQALVKGIATAHSYSEFKKEFRSNIEYVWKSEDGDIIGQEIEPLYEKQVFAVKNDHQLYKTLALIDLLRTGNKREISFAEKELKNFILR